MDTKRIKGLQVITLAGVKAGTVDQIFFDHATKHVAGFVLQADPARTTDASPRLVEADDVHALGADALIVPDDGAIRDPQTGTPLATLVDMDELAKRQVVTEGGTRLGQVAVDEVALVAAAQLVHGEVRDADEHRLAVDLHPLVRLRVLAVAGAHAVPLG